MSRPATKDTLPCTLANKVPTKEASLNTLSSMPSVASAFRNTQVLDDAQCLLDFSKTDLILTATTQGAIGYCENAYFDAAKESEILEWINPTTNSKAIDPSEYFIGRTQLSLWIPGGIEMAINSSDDNNSSVTLFSAVDSQSSQLFSPTEKCFEDSSSVDSSYLPESENLSKSIKNRNAPS